MRARKTIPHQLIEDKPRAPKVRASKMGKWRALVLILVHVIIALHIAHWLIAGETITPVEPSEAMAFSRSSIINAGLIFFAVTILSTAVFGRFFCGWGCHVLALQDFCRYLMLKIGVTPRPLKTRTLVWVPTLAFFYMFLWPLLYRLWIGDSLAVRGTELVTTQFWATFPGAVVGVMTFLVCGFACVYFLGAKGFCTYGCPYGAIFAAADRVSPLRIRVTDACEQCGHCTAVCSSNVRVHEEVRDWGMVVSPGCMKCMDCVSVCPKDALYYGAGPIPFLSKPRVAETAAQREQRLPPVRSKLDWREELLLVTAFVVCFLSVRGLYGVIPFLMSLGVAAVVAFLALTTWKLIGEANVERSGLRLKRAGKLLPQGRAFVVVVVALAGLLAHSAAVRVQTYLADRIYDDTELMRLALLATPGLLPITEPASVARLQQGVSHLHRIDRWGLVVTLGNAAKLAWLEALSGDYAASAIAARQALERGELPAQMHQLLARAAIHAGDRDHAIREWRAAIAQQPNLSEAYLALGSFLAQGGELTSAREVFDLGWAAVPDSPELLYNAGLARALSGASADAIAFFERALTLRPKYVEARENLAGLLASLGRFEESIVQFRLAVAQSPRDGGTRVLLARALLAQGDREAARRELENALEIDVNDADARELLLELIEPGV